MIFNYKTNNANYTNVTRMLNKERLDKEFQEVDFTCNKYQNEIQYKGYNNKYYEFDDNYNLKIEQNEQERLISNETNTSLSSIEDGNISNIYNNISHKLSQQDIEIFDLLKRMAFNGENIESIIKDKVKKIINDVKSLVNCEQIKDHNQELDNQNYENFFESL